METKYKRVVEFSKLTRIFHWIRAITIFVLIGTGFYLGYPFLAPNNFSGEPTGFLYALMRSWHLIFGFALIAVTIFRIYLFFTKECAKERRSFSDFINPMVWIGVIKAYLLLGGHPHLKGSYNPLQLITYITIMLLILAISLTGLVLYANVYHEGFGGFIAPLMKPIEVLCGGLANVRSIHHILTWAFVIFIPIHIYMAVWNATRYPGGGIDSIISGAKFEKE
ncbi:Ni/Fe-hydrogenase, b-type cytochrome subunit [Helicobacter sp.]|uniref:Ni/Fe-hydrogenase, b-type cytochrome subunit n=1 Tax=Helicobacter sp. TaxID=218 RepID=UPI0025B919B2|nr:Ni/Fe-hydrogenase, b-type cytochrome subunit [Helicobacter sp.]MCI5968298.1 Ni/Fe-hydrogenase, b-type cytochrome subunit [Helicobacter sp.]MDY2585390.1 Ni/Fe-hydrogenase, b-type cytochrome subunit [Helicobacter sp.]